MRILFRRRGLALAASLLAVTGGVAAAADSSHGTAARPARPVGQSAGPASAVINIPLPGATGGAFLGHYYFVTASDLAWFQAGAGASTTGGLAVLDVSNPEQPLPAGALPLPHFENEDLTISASRKLAVISQDRGRSVPGDKTKPVIPGRIYVVDISVPQAPHLLSVTQLPASVGTYKGVALAGPGHTATFVDHDQYLWISGARDRSAYVMDVRDPSAPKLVGNVVSPAGADNGFATPGLVHDAYVDQFGDSWLVGTGGTAMYAPLTDPLHPRLLARTDPAANDAYNKWIHHNVIRLDRSTILVTEEDTSSGTCNKGRAGPNDGSLQAWRIDLKHKLLRPLSAYQLPTADSGTGVESSGICSSHWFSTNGRGLVADAWYGGGVRFLDARHPGALRLVGGWAGQETLASQAVFVPGRPDLVYVADYIRGVDVVRFDGTAASPAVSDAAAARLVPVKTAAWKADPDYGWICGHIALPAAGAASVGRP